MKYFVFILIFFSACSFKPEAIVDNTKTFILKDNNEDLKQNFIKNNKILKITNAYVPIYLNNQNLMYVDKLNSSFYALNFLEDTPSNFYVFMLLSKFERADFFKALVSENSNLLADYLLESRIDSFEQIMEQNENYVLIKISVNLIDLNTNKLINHNYFQIKEKIEKQEINLVINTLNKALNVIGNDIVVWTYENLNKKE